MPVSARFHARRDRMLAAVDRDLAEPVRLSFMADGQADPARPQMEIEAILRGGKGEEGSQGKNIAAARLSRQPVGRWRLHIDRARHPDLRFKNEDRVRAIARPGEPLFEVLAVDDRSHTRLVLELGEAR